jgi:anti-sigma-K factor RskA
MTTAHPPRFEEMLPAYALGALDGEDRREFEAHLVAGCSECRRQLDLWERDLAELAAAVPPVVPSAETRRRVLESAGVAIPGTREAAPGVRSRRTGGRWLWLLPAAAGLALVVWSGWAQVRWRGEVERLQAERDRLARQVTALESQRDLAQAEAQRMAQALGFITSPGVRSIQLAGLEPAPGASGHTFVDPRRGQAVFYASGLPALAPDRTYQLWFIADQPVSAGVFAVDEDGNASLRVADVAAGVQAWAVTIEPQGGVPQPTGPMVLKG